MASTSPLTKKVPGALAGRTDRPTLRGSAAFHILISKLLRMLPLGRIESAEQPTGLFSVFARGVGRSQLGAKAGESETRQSLSLTVRTACSFNE